MGLGFRVEIRVFGLKRILAFYLRTLLGFRVGIQERRFLGAYRTM